MKNYFVVFVCGIFILSCNNAGQTDATSKDSMTDTIDTTGNMGISNMPDSVTNGSLSSNTSNSSNEFVTKAAAGGMMEVEMGKIAQTNGGSDDVKNYGKMLEKDHTDANNKLKEIAEAENISMPGTMLPEQQQHVDHLNTLKGKDFDKAYISMMVEDHNKDIADFKTAAASNENEKVKAFASATVPTLEAHLAKAKSMNAKLN